MTMKEGLPKTREGLSEEAFAIVGDPEDPETWKLPHHKSSILRTRRRKINIEQTVGWKRMLVAVATLSPNGYLGQRVEASPGEILQAADHLAKHYRKAEKPLPDTLAVLA